MFSVIAVTSILKVVVERTMSSSTTGPTAKPPRVLFNIYIPPEHHFEIQPAVSLTVVQSKAVSP